MIKLFKHWLVDGDLPLRNFGNQMAFNIDVDNSLLILRNPLKIWQILTKIENTCKKGLLAV